MKKDKELIEEIIHKMKAQEDLPYRKGAWERFQQQQKQQQVILLPHRSLRKWYAAAAVIAVLGVGSLFVAQRMLHLDRGAASIAENSHPAQQKESDKAGAADTPAALMPQSNHTDGLHRGEFYATNKPSVSEGMRADVMPIRNAEMHKSLLPELDAEDLQELSKGLHIAQVKPVTPLVERKVQPINEVHRIKDFTTESSLLASTGMDVSGLRSKGLDHTENHKRFNLGNKFDVALFVSPTATTDKMNFAGGLALAYTVTKNLSVRTGASYNTYQVGVLKDPHQPSSAATVHVSESVDLDRVNLISNSKLKSNEFVLPNVNAISGVVQSIDIPLEVKYNVGKMFYAAAGVSYSAIVNQQRNAQFVDNVNFESFQNGYPNSEKQQSELTKATTKTVKTIEQNVSTNGFNGFVNFSLGKKVKVNNRFGVSVEPYVKLPVGQYRRADMDYTNGGLRIMTNF